MPNTILNTLHISNLFLKSPFEVGVISSPLQMKKMRHKEIQELAHCHTTQLLSTGCCCCYSVAQSCLILCDPMDCSTPGFPVHHQLLEFTQTHVHSVSDAIQPSHPLLPSSPFAFSPSQHQGLFQVDNAEFNSR